MIINLGTNESSTRHPSVLGELPEGGMRSGVIMPKTPLRNKGGIRSGIILPGPP